MWSFQLKMARIETGVFKPSRFSAIELCFVRWSTLFLVVLNLEKQLVFLSIGQIHWEEKEEIFKKSNLVKSTLTWPVSVVFHVSLLTRKGILKWKQVSSPDLLCISGQCCQSRIWNSYFTEDCQVVRNKRAQPAHFPFHSSLVCGRQPVNLGLRSEIKHLRLGSNSY